MRSRSRWLRRDPKRRAPAHQRGLGLLGPCVSRFRLPSAPIITAPLVLKIDIDGKWKSRLDGGYMKTKTTVIALALCFIGGATCFANSPQMGTWKLNEAKSKLVKWMAKNRTVVYAPAGRSIKVTVDGVDAKGKPIHNEWTGKFDGKDYPVTGDPTSDMRSYKKVDDNTLDITIKKGGKVTPSGRIVVAADGKTRTITISGTNPKGKKFTSLGVYDKQ